LKVYKHVRSRGYMKFMIRRDSRTVEMWLVDPQHRARCDRHLSAELAAKDWSAYKKIVCHILDDSGVAEKCNTISGLVSGSVGASFLGTRNVFALITGKERTNMNSDDI
jgi:hypothetical protein